MSWQRDLAWQMITLRDRSSVSHQVARYALTLDYDLIPEAVRHQAKRCLLDGLGCALGALEAPGYAICAGVAEELGGKPEATLWGSGLRTGVLGASLVNAFLVRFLDYNDMGLGNHPSDCLASLVAVAEREGKSGRDLLTAIVISYELAGRFNDALDFVALAAEGWTGEVKAGYNMTPALGKLMGLDEAQIAHAMGTCLSHTLPLKILDSDRDEHVMAKNLRFGWAAHDAILACLLARRGFTGPLRIFESDEGLNKLLTRGKMDLEKLVDFSGWRIHDVMFKAMAANGTTHGHVFATLDVVRTNDLKPQDIAAVEIRTSTRESRHTTTLCKKYPRNAESADHSAFYANAIAIIEGAFGPDQISPEKFTDPLVLDLIERITVKGDPDLGFFAGISRITTKDGRVFESRVDVPYGIAEKAMSDAGLEAKFRDLAGRHLPAAQVNALCDTVWNLEDLANVGDLARLMVVPEPG